MNPSNKTWQKSSIVPVSGVNASHSRRPSGDMQEDAMMLMELARVYGDRFALFTFAQPVKPERRTLRCRRAMAPSRISSA